MGSSKTYQFTQEEISLSLVGRALAHPARITILKYLKENGICRNVDLMPVLQLGKTTVHEHLLKLKDAGLIDVEFTPLCSYNVYLMPGAMKRFYVFVGNVTEN